MLEPSGVDARPLAGTRFLDLSGNLSVYWGKLLADVRADVIKVMPANDGAAHAVTFFEGREEALRFLLGG